MLRLRLLAALPLFFMTLTLLTAQPEDNGLLYFPPKLTVKVSSDPMWMYRIFGGMMSEDTSVHSAPFSDKITFTRNMGEGTLALLPMVFFDQGSNVIPERYQTFTGSADADNYVDTGEINLSDRGRESNNDLSKYYQVLNVIGYRMAYTDSVVIALEGGYSTEPGENPKLASERAQVLSEYLTNVWHIQPERIRLLPPRRMCDSSANVLRQEEARRVIVYSSNPSLFRPVHYLTSDVPASFIVFSVVIDPQMPPEEVAGMNLVIALGDEVLGTTKISTSPDSTIYHLTGLWYLPRNLNDIEENLTVQLFVSCSDGRLRASNQIGIPIVIEEQRAYNDSAFSREYMESTGGEYSDEGEGDEGYDENGESYKTKDETTVVGYDGTDSLPSFTPYESPESFEIEIPFFESSDTTLSSLQQQWFAHDLDSIKQSLTAWPDVRWTISLNGEGEPGENPALENGQIVAQAAAYRSITGFYSGLWKDRSFQISVYFIKPFDKTNMENFDFQSFNTDLVNTMYGNRADEINNVSKEWSKMNGLIMNAMGNKEQLDTFLTRRATGAIPFLLRTLDTARIDTIVSDSRAYYGLDFKYTPEERFYQRKIDIMISPYNQYQTYDGYNYDGDYNDGEYQEGEDNEGEYQEGEGTDRGEYQEEGSEGEYPDNDEK